MEDIMVSICCLTYNHEKYVREALDSFLNQKTNFKYEILIHDDASTDRTVEIIREYEEKYPNLIKPIYQKENQYSKGINISKTYQFPRACGKYIAMCEGDDYWKDDYKLQKQFDALEKNADCGICTCIVEHIAENGESKHIYQPDKKVLKSILTEIIEPKEIFTKVFEQTIIPFQTSSFFVRKCMMDNYLKENPNFAQTNFFGDVPLLLYFVAHGNVCFLPEILSAYREFSIGSWTNKHFNVREKKIKHHIEIINMFKKYNSYTENIFENSIEKIISKYEFLLYELQGKYGLLLQRKYKTFFKERCFKEKSYIILHAFLGVLK